MTVGRVVRELRMNHGLTQDALEASTGGLITRSYVSKLEQDAIAMPSRERLNALAAALHTTTHYILERAGVIAAIAPEVEQGIATFLAAYPEFEALFQIAQDISPAGRRRLLNYARLVAMEEQTVDLSEVEVARIARGLEARRPSARGRKRAAA